jgi:hypothetical protein
VQTTDTSPAAATGSQHPFLFAALAAATLLVAAWSSPGLAAAHLAIGCDKMAKNLQSADVEKPAIDLVDLSDVSESEDAADNLTGSVAPLLFLTPRVASIVENVFGDRDEATGPQGDQEALTADLEKPVLENSTIEQARPATPPVVDNTNSSRLGQPVSPMYEHAAILPRFQRQMYRTDI